MAKETFSGFAKIIIVGKEEQTDAPYLAFKAWEKGNIKRIYVNDYKKRTVGYYENGSFSLIDRQGLMKSELEPTLAKFAEKYAF